MNDVNNVRFSENYYDVKLKSSLYIVLTQLLKMTLYLGRRNDNISYFLFFSAKPNKKHYLHEIRLRKEKKKGSVMTFVRNLYEMRHSVEAPQMRFVEAARR